MLGLICDLKFAHATFQAGHPQISLASFQDEEGCFDVTTSNAIWYGTLFLERADMLTDAEGMIF